MGNVPLTRDDFDKLIQPKITEALFSDPRNQSVTQKIFRKINVGFNGVRIPNVTEKPEAYFVDEAREKPTTSTTYEAVDVKPRKIACIGVFSNELYKLDPAGVLEQFEKDVVDSFNKKHDQLMMETITSASINAGVTPVIFNEATPYDSILEAEKTLLGAGKDLNFFAMDKKTLPALDTAKDQMGRPLFNEYGLSTEANFKEFANRDVEGSLVRYPAIFHKELGIETTDPQPLSVLGIAGDSNKAVASSIEMETPRIIAGYKDAQGVDHFAGQENLTCVLFEAYVSFALGDGASFVPYVKATTKKATK